MGLILKPSVPDWKQVNLYQYGLTSVTSAQLLVGTDLPPQSGTLACEKVLVPQTGKAVDGFCPGAVQVCASRPVQNITMYIAVRRNLIVLVVPISLVIEQANILNAAYGRQK